MKMQTAALLVLLAAAGQSQADYAAAYADLDSFPVEERGRVYYATTSPNSDEFRTVVENAAKFIIPSTSTQRIIEYSRPEQISPTLWRIQLDRAHWKYAQWRKVLEDRNCYGGFTQVVRLDWLTQEIYDGLRSNSHYRLLYGTEKLDRDDFVKTWGVTSDLNFALGMVEGQSRVAVSKIRRIENRPTAGRYEFWETFDSAVIDNESDPLTNPVRGHKHQASELIVQSEVRSLLGDSGALQYYLLANGKGERQEEAPGSIVVNYVATRGRSSIVSPIDCAACHIEGMNQPTFDAYRAAVRAGVEPGSYDKNRVEEIDLYYVKLDGAIQAANAAYAAGIKMCNGLTPEENAGNLMKFFAGYDQALTLEAAARELYTAPEQLKLALAYYGELYPQKTIRLAALAHDQTIARSLFESNYTTFLDVLAVWREVNN